MEISKNKFVVLAVAIIALQVTLLVVYLPLFRPSSEKQDVSIMTAADAVFLAEKYAVGAKHMAFTYHIMQHERKRYSQFGEDGIVEYIFDNVGTTNKYYVEFGTEDGSECVSRNLFEQYGFTGLMLDGGIYDNSGKPAGRQIHQTFMTAENIVATWQKHQVPEIFDFWMLDLDRNDQFIAEKIFEAGYRPRVIGMEINRNFYPHQSYTQKYNSSAKWDGSHRMGRSPLAATRLCNKYGYSLAGFDSEGINSFFIHRKTLVEMLNLKTGSKYNFHERDVKLMEPTIEALWKTVGTIHYDRDGLLFEDIQRIIFKEEGTKEWQEVGPDGVRIKN